MRKTFNKRLILEKISFEILRQPKADLMSHSSPTTSVEVSLPRKIMKINQGVDDYMLYFYI